MSARMGPLELPLADVRLVEASAGTGKTFTIATLYLRLILERGLTPEHIVVATFTRAATAELAMRLRARLRLASEMLRQEDPAQPCDGDDGEMQATRGVIAQALGHAALETLATRARTAEWAMDTAVIGTLHAFCNRVLGEFGFETGHALGKPELLEDTRALQQEIVEDFWRSGSADADVARLLTETWSTPDALARQATAPRWRGRRVANAVELAAAARDARSRRSAALAQLDAIRNAIAGWDDATLQVAAQELADCIRHAGAVKNRVDGLRQLHAWARAGTAPDLLSSAARKAVDDLAEGALSAMKSCKRLPQGPVFAAVADLTANLAALAGLDDASRAQLLLEARAYLDRELPKRMRALGVTGHDQAVDRLAAALDDPRLGAAAASAIRERWPVALVDEFQDTDPQQWRIFRKLFAHPKGTLVLIGDPKQAIYGFRGGDVHAWLLAREQAEGEPLRLDESQRAGRGVNAGINALFSRDDAFVEKGIKHEDVHAAARVAERALLVDGVPVAGVQAWRIPATGTVNKDGSARTWYKGDAQTRIEAACVARIVEWLQGAREGRVLLRDGDGSTRALRARDIAVLVDSNREARSMQNALARAGVPAASCLRASVYASEEAGDLRLLLEALRDPANASRARAARASVLVGDDASAIAKTCNDASALNALLIETSGWAASVERRGPLPLLHLLVARAAPRLLAEPDGQRSVANYLQLADLLQDMHASCFGMAELCERYARSLRENTSDTDADAVRLRLDNDAQAVQIATVHAAKGLEYGVVLLPCVASGRAARSKGKQPALTWYHEGNTACVAVGHAVEAEIESRAREELLAEEVRKLYVAVTRARAACVFPWGYVSQAEQTAMYWLLHATGRDTPLPFDEAGCDQALAEWVERSDEGAVVSPLPNADARRLPKLQDGPTRVHAAEFHQKLERDWQTWSFSRLVRGSSNHAVVDAAPGAGDGDGISIKASGPGGARFGTAVHTVLEQTDFAAWHDGVGIPAGERTLIERALRGQGLDSGRAAMQQTVELVGACVRSALNATLPCHARLCEIAPEQRKAEIEFHLSLAPAHSAALYALLHRHGYQRQRSGVTPTTLHGLLTGKIDLTFQHAGRFHIVDWKTNRCPPYDDAALRAEIALHDYDLQWLIYTLALHRWLGQQLPDYDYDRHVGEAYYLFVRGMGEGHGVHADRPPRELIEAMDALFDSAAREAA
ncbi:MAG TPA: UvrD-helicase domain-containing protein [Rhodanobacteraceae bacterium]